VQCNNEEILDVVTTMVVFCVTTCNSTRATQQKNKAQFLLDFVVSVKCDNSRYAHETTKVGNFCYTTRTV